MSNALNMACTPSESDGYSPRYGNVGSGEGHGFSRRSLIDSNFEKLLEVVRGEESGYEKSFAFPQGFRTVNEEYSKWFSTTSSSNESLENYLNEESKHKFKKQHSSRFIQLLRDYAFEYGFASQAENLVRKCLAENRAVTKEWLNELYIQHFGDVAIVSGILCVLSHFEYCEMAPNGMTMVLSSFSHKSSVVREGAIRVCENWGNKESLDVLKTADIQDAWLKDYLNEVMSDIEKELRTHGTSR